MNDTRTVCIVAAFASAVGLSVGIAVGVMVSRAGGTVSAGLTEVAARRTRLASAARVPDRREPRAVFGDHQVGVNPPGPGNTKDLAGVIRNTPTHALGRKVEQFVGTIPAEDVPKWIPAAAELRDGSGRGWTVLRSLLSRWAVADPAEALRFALQCGADNASEGHECARVALQTWALTDLHAAYRAWQKLPAGRRKWGLLEDMFHDVSAGQGAEHLKFALSLDSRREQTHALNRLAKAWSQVDLDAAVAALDDIPLDLQKSYYGGLRNQWVAWDPSSAAPYFATMLTHEQSHEWHWIAVQWAQADLAGALEWVATIPIGRRRTEAEGAVLTEWANSDPASALAFALAMEPCEQRKELRWRAVHNWVRTDTSAAIEWIEAHAPPERRAQMIEHGIASLASVDAAAAIALWERSALPEPRRVLMLKVISGHLDDDPSDLLDWIPDLGEADKAIALAYAVKSDARPDPVRLVGLINDLEDEHSRGELLGKAAEKWAYLNPAEAIEWAGALENKSQSETMLSRICLCITWRDLDWAGSIALSLEDEALRERTVKSVVSEYGQYAPVEGRAFVEELTDPNLKDAALVSLANKVGEYDPETATAIADGITDEDKRHGQIVEAVSQWARLDASAAIEWVSTCSLHDDKKTALLKKLGEGRL